MNLLIIVLAVVFGLAGFTGGIWFWRKMAESPIWKQIRIYVKMVGICGAAVSFGILIFLSWKTKTQPPEFFLPYLTIITIGGCFLLFYMLGYDTSILWPKSNEITGKFRIKWDLLIKELLASIIFIIPAVVLLLFSRIGIQFFKMWVAGMMGFGIGFFFWEHLKETGIIAGDFRRQLVIISLVATVVVGCIAGYGLYVCYFARNVQSVQILLAIFILPLQSIAWYMVGLCVVVFRIGKISVSFRLPSP